VIAIGLSLEKMDELFGVATAATLKSGDVERAVSHDQGDKKGEDITETRVERV
jgi:hypothetical protein